MDEIAGQGCTEALVQGYLCRGHTRVVLQMPLPPTDDTASSDEWYQCMRLLMKWQDKQAKEVQPELLSWKARKQRFMDLGCRNIAMPPVFLAQVCIRLPQCVRHAARAGVAACARPIRYPSCQ